MSYSVPAAPSRSLFNVQGACRAVFNGAQFYHTGDAKLDLKPATSDIKIAGLRSPSRRVTDRVAKMSLTPEGIFDASVIAALWPYLAVPVGTPIIGDSDVPLVLHGRNSDLATVKNAAVEKMPDIMFDARKSLVGAVNFVGALATGKLPTASDAYFTYAGSGGTFARTGFNTALIKTQRYTLSVGNTANGFQVIDTQDGLTFSPEVKLEPCLIPGLGTLTWRVAEVSATLKFKPFGPSIAQIATLLGYGGNDIGSELNAQGLQVIVTGADGIAYLTLSQATLQDAEIEYGDKPMRAGELQFFASTAYNGDGSEQPVAILAASTPTIVILGTLAAGIKNTAYRQALAGSGGAAPYTFALATGSLPAGLTLSDTGIVSGTPTADGSSPFTITATDYNGVTVTQSYTIVISG